MNDKHNSIDLWSLMNEYKAKGFATICGVDEAGRGPLAGPVCAAAVILPDDYKIPGLNDSKQLTDKKRKELYPVIMRDALSYGISFVSEEMIDRDNILQATLFAMRSAVKQLYLKPDIVLVDGNRNTEFGTYSETVVKGDARVAAIAAASILAKVARDQYMEAIDAVYPEYGFAIHKGYGTKRHYEAIDKYGPCPIHRKSFLKKYYGLK